MRGSYQTTPDTVQNASAEKTRVWVVCALAATRKQLADEKLEWPNLFKEALLVEYRERAIYEKSPSSIVVELEHPHFLSKVAWVSHQLPQEVSTFEFEKTESSTLFYGKEPPRPRRQGSTLVPVPMPPKEIEHAKFCRVAAFLRALDWWCQQLEWRLQPPEVGSVLKKEDEPSGPKPTQMPLGWPAYYPNDLIPQTTVIIAEALRECPVQTQTLQLCKSVISKLTPHLCAAVEGKTLRADLALSSMSDLLDSLLVYNCDDSSERFRLKQELMKSDEWLKLAEEMARVPSTGRPQGQPRETTGHKGDKPSKGRYQDRDEIILRVHNENPATPFREQCLKIATALYDDGKERGVVHHFPSAWGEKSPLKMLQSGSKAQRRKPVDLFRQVINRKSAKKRCKRRPTD